MHAKINKKIAHLISARSDENKVEKRVTDEGSAISYLTHI